MDFLERNLYKKLLFYSRNFVHLKDARLLERFAKRSLIVFVLCLNVLFLKNTDAAEKNVFSNFDFKKVVNNSPTTLAASSPFAFLANMTKTIQQNTNTNGLNNSPKTSTTSMFKMPDSTTTSMSNITSNSNSTTSLINKSTEKSNSYYAKLKGLNESVSQWIKTHVDKNPFVILSPIFKDYEKHLAEIEASKDAEVATVKSGATTSEKNSFKLPTSTEKSIFGNSSFTSTPPNENPFLSNSNKSFEKNDTLVIPKKTENSVPTFSFGSNAKLPTTPSIGFSFNATTPFTFSNVSKPVDQSDKKEEAQEDEDEPPKVEFTPVVEEGNIFSKRCKIFIKKEDAFKDRGVGQLFLKPVEGSEKIQLIVRADTSLGNLILNFILSAAIPIQRMGKNNVMLVCIPTPHSKPPPTPVLLRVKTEDEADDLLKVLEKHRK